MLKKIITILLFITFGSGFSQQVNLVIPNGTRFYIPNGAQIATNLITVDLYGVFISEDPSGVPDSVTIQGDGYWSLPVELNLFTAELKNNTVILKWSTATEVNNYGFEVLRNTLLNPLSSLPEVKAGGEAEGRGVWTKIGFVEGNGNSNSPKEYSFTDKNLVGGTKFQYRLKKIDNDGKYEYSDIVEINFIPTEFALYQNYPNPFNPVTKIRYQLPKASKISIKLYDILGSEVMELVNEQKEAGVYECELNASNLTSGTYIYRIIADQFVQSKKIMHLK